jgi:hypothetical protein
MYVQQYMDNEYPLLYTIIVLEPGNIGYRGGASRSFVALGRCDNISCSVLNK